MICHCLTPGQMFLILLVIVAVGGVLLALLWR